MVVTLSSAPSMRSGRRARSEQQRPGFLTAKIAAHLVWRLLLRQPAVLSPVGRPAVLAPVRRIDLLCFIVCMAAGRTARFGCGGAEL